MDKEESKIPINPVDGGETFGHKMSYEGNFYRFFSGRESGLSAACGLLEWRLPMSEWDHELVAGEQCDEVDGSDEDKQITRFVRNELKERFSEKTNAVADLNICKSYEGQRISDENGWAQFQGECATGVQYVCWKSGNQLKQTVDWRPGRQAKGGGLKTGTAIASFRDGRYKDDHAAIFIREVKEGLVVWDQFNNSDSEEPPKPWGERVLRFDKPDWDYSNNGNLFYEILNV